MFVLVMHPQATSGTEETILIVKVSVTICKGVPVLRLQVITEVVISYMMPQ